MEYILKVKDLSVEIEGERVLENLSFEVAENETLVILGPNGAGKTVLLRSLLGLIPYQGMVEWQKGIKIGYVPQGLPLVKDIPISIKEFFKLRNIADEEILEIMDAIGMKRELLEKNIGHLSSGQFQRVLIGLGISGNPRVLLFDEPTTGIDVGGEETIYNLLEKLKVERKLTILLVSHDLSIVYKFAAKVLCLSKKAICMGSPREVLTSEMLARLYGGEVKFYQHDGH